MPPLVPLKVSLRLPYIHDSWRDGSRLALKTHAGTGNASSPRSRHRGPASPQPGNPVWGLNFLIPAPEHKDFALMVRLQQEGRRPIGQSQFLLPPFPILPEIQTPLTPNRPGTPRAILGGITEQRGIEGQGLGETSAR